MIRNALRGGARKFAHRLFIRPLMGAIPVLIVLGLGWGCSGSSSSSSGTRAPVASTVTFSPTSTSINNPTATGQTTSASTVTLTVSVLDHAGNTLTPSTSSPLTVSVHGAPAGVVTPATQTITSGNTVTLSYNGQFFLHPVLVRATIPNGAGGHAIGTTQLLQTNQICDYTQPGLQSFTANLTSATPVENGLQISAVVGFANAVASDLQTFTIDTGSLGVVVPASDIGPDKVGPGPASEKMYDSSGNTYIGNLYTAPVSFQTSGGAIISTTPIPVLVSTSTACAPNNTCTEAPPNTLHYLGVGFDRNASTSLDLSVGPAFNAFLHLDDAANGSDISPGYIFNAQTAQVTLGLNSTGLSGFTLAALTANQTVPGDWLTGPGCFSFPNNGGTQFCGTLLMDVGISEMFLQLFITQRPADTQTKQQNGNAYQTIVPSSPPGVRMTILAGSSSSPAMSYSYTTSATPIAPAPSNVVWGDKPQIFVNTGRRVLAAFNYLFDSQCGQFGFKPV